MQEKIDDLRKNGYLAFDTKLLVTDMMFYNSLADIYTIVIIQTDFKPNGFIDSSKMEFLNIKGKYYEMSRGITVFRLICEILYVIILIYYIVIEVYQIF